MPRARPLLDRQRWIGRALAAAAGCALFGAAGARAGDNDLQLWRLGNPDGLPNCSFCTDLQKSGDPAAQMRFARMSAALGLAFVPAFVEAAGTIGQAGFELGFSESGALLKLAPNEWATAGNWDPKTKQPFAAPAVLAVSTLALRKGLGGSIELGAHFSYLAGSQILGVGAQIRFALLDGLDYAPDLALRAFGTRLLGTADLDLTVAGADVLLSKSWGVGGMIKLQPYFQYGLTFIHATSGVVDFRPDTEAPRDPTAVDGVFRTIQLFENSYNRFALGLRLVAGAAVIGLEGSVAFGTNPVQSDKLAGNVAPPTQFTRQFGFGARLGVGF